MIVTHPARTNSTVSDFFCPDGDSSTAPDAIAPVPGVSLLDDSLDRYLAARGMTLPIITTGAKLLEESQEVVDAIAAGDERNIREEIGDVAIVLAVIARQYNTTVEACVAEKMLRDTGRGE